MPSGYQGKDSMREKAESMFRDNFSGVHKLNKGQSDLHMPRLLDRPKDTLNMQNMSDLKRAKAFANGGYADGGKAPKVQKKLIGGAILGGGLGGYAGSKLGRNLGKMVGGDEGADLGNWLGSTAGSTLGGLAGTAFPAFKKGGDVKNSKSEAKKMLRTRGKANGGSVYEREMVGEHPTHTPHHFNYEAQMKGEKPLRRAAGGVAKMRLGQASSSGKPVMKQMRTSAVC